MLWNLIKFEWIFWKGKKNFYLMLAFYLIIGFITATVARFPFPETHKNSPYVINYILGIISLLTIFSTTILAAQSLFREKDAGFDSIIFTTPVKKAPYVASRFLIIFFINVICYFLLICGLAAGHIMSAGNGDDLSDFNMSYYLQPFFLLLIPNIIFCTAVACSIGLVTRNKMLVYSSGIFLYFLYWGVAMFTNSPLIANSIPVSASAMSASALLDPFGLAAFLEQTRYWTAPERNTQLLSPSGNILMNRILYLFASTLLLLLAYRKFSMKLSQSQKKNNKQSTKTPVQTYSYKTIPTQTVTIAYHFKALLSLVRIEWLNIVKSVPLWIVCIGWIGVFGIELFSDISSNARIPEKFAATGLIVSEILSAFPIVGLMILLFYGTEVFWRSHSSGFSSLEETTAVQPITTLLARWLPLVGVILLFTSLNIIIGVGCQLLLQQPNIDWSLYLSLFYLMGLPLALSAMLIVSIQAFIGKKYPAIALAAIILFLTNTSMGNMVRLKHPLLKFANAFQGTYSEMNGFDIGLSAFHNYILYWICISGIIFLFAASVWKYKKGIRLSFERKSFSLWPGIGLIALCVGAFSFALPIYKETIIVNEIDLNNWKQLYEKKYKRLKDIPQPVVTDIQTNIDLFPESESYHVSAQYTVVNKGTTPIDTLFIYEDKEMEWEGWDLGNAGGSIKDTVFGYRILKLGKALQPGDSIKPHFSFYYRRSPYNKATAHNTIISNGSFIRVERYFPKPGYNGDNEINDPNERKKRDMPESDILPAIDAPRDTLSAEQFITLDATISTSNKQTAICIGELTGAWKKDGRNYFRYTSSSPVPFRFAVSSAAYAVKKIRNKEVNIEMYYYPGHYQNTDRFLSAAIQTLDYCNENIGPYPFKTLRLIEISAFTRGFAGTAYPTNLFINEAFGFQNKIDGNPARDIITEMVSHEVSHTWWGNAKISAAYREGGRLMTETLAMYTELMIYKKIYGEQFLLDRVNVHKDIYLGDRSFSTEEPLYRSHYNKPHLCYDKGMVVMYQLYKLLGEEKMNIAIKNFYDKNAHPHPDPISTDLVNEFYAVAEKNQYDKIDELFKRIITYDLTINKVSVENKKTGYSIHINAQTNKYEEDGKGNKKLQAFTEPVEAVISFDDEEKKIVILRVNNNKIDTAVEVSKRPTKIVLDPDGKFLTVADEKKEKQM